MASSYDNFKDFFVKYDPPIQPYKHTCVGLAIEVMHSLRTLENDFPGIQDSIMLVSCEENIQDLIDYTVSYAGPQSFLIETEKDHVMVACNVVVDDRPGVFLSDLGYHISRVVTVMKDRCYPHTGWFTHTNKHHCVKEFNYEFNTRNLNYIEWEEKEIKADRVKERLSLVYIEKAFLSSVEVTEKRNLVWHVKSLLARNAEGSLIAGIYFISKKKETNLTLFYTTSDDTKQRKKFNLETFLEPQKLPQIVIEDVKRCNIQLRLQEGKLLTMLQELAIIMTDVEFVTGMYELNDKIKKLSARKT